MDAHRQPLDTFADVPLIALMDTDDEDSHIDTGDPALSFLVECVPISTVEPATSEAE